jgi:hypothetical protein
MADIVYNSNIDLLNGARVVNAQQAVNATDYMTLGQGQALVNNLNTKESVRAASTANINLASPGATVDGVTMVLGDRFLTKDQTTASQNGIYIWNGAAVAATRSPDANTFDELEAASVMVEEGTTNANTRWRQTQVNGTIDSTNVVFASDSSSAPAASESIAGVAEIATQGEADAGTDDSRFLTPSKAKNASWMMGFYSIPFGDGTATSFVITHGLNNIGAHVNVRLTNSPFDRVFVEEDTRTANSVTLKTNTAPAAGAYTADVIG